MRRSAGFRETSITTILIYALIIGFLLQTFLEPWLFGLGALNKQTLLQGQIWRLVTHMFLHGGLFHLTCNALGLWFAGREVERVLGPRRYLIIFFGGGIIGGLAQVFLGGTNAPIIGASGGVFAVLMAFCAIYAEYPITALLFFVLPIRLKAKNLGIALIAFSIIFWLSGLEPNVAHLSHLGGSLLGLALVSLWGYGLPFRFPWKNPPRHPFTSFSPETGVEDIFQKIARDGIHSLTREERRRLEDHFARRRSQR